MQCNCGCTKGTAASATTRTKGQGTWLLSYSLCSNCGRAGSEMLHHQATGAHPQLIARGLDARALYLDIERGTYPETPKPAAPKKTLEQKLASLLTTGPEATQWPTPDPEKKLTVERGRHYLICHAGDWEIRVLYFSWIYACSWHVFVPLIDYQQTGGPSDIEITLTAHRQIIKALNKLLAAQVTSAGVTCAPPLQLPVQIRNRITGEAIHLERSEPATTEIPPSVDTTAFEQCALF